ncbi:hypothetical protein TGPRC2_201895 [Toxoplasma gondii TgCatPRC2]|uniref:Uncharacterized protein n=1 Tax=Toxoplasma gondii TgCatPRC2 TaxID=1130821 RepID=A0A151HB88_TOXGO|nr:hypothetical protein TGPRC2_201895 [Toxoplasma gondii TgCatPRC2]
MEGAREISPKPKSASSMKQEATSNSTNRSSSTSSSASDDVQIRLKQKTRRVGGRQNQPRQNERAKEEEGESEAEETDDSNDTEGANTKRWRNAEKNGDPADKSSQVRNDLLDEMELHQEDTGIIRAATVPSYFLAEVRETKKMKKPKSAIVEVRPPHKFSSGQRLATVRSDFKMEQKKSHSSSCRELSAWLGIFFRKRKICKTR